MSTTHRPPARTAGHPIVPLFPTPRAVAHWGLAHGLPSLMLRRAAARGDLQADLIAAGHDESGDVVGAAERVRAVSRVYRSAIGVVVTGHADVRHVLTSDEFTTGLTERFPGGDDVLGRLIARLSYDWVNPVQPPSLLATEPPDHTRYRKLVTRVFTVRAVEKLRRRTEEIAADLLDDLEASGADPVDVVAAYCTKLPVRVIAEILGVPESEHETVLGYGEGAAASLDVGLTFAEYRSVQGALRGFDGWLDDHLTRLEEQPGDNLLSELVAARDHGVGLDRRELKATAGLVLAAGFETTVNLLSNGIALLAERPDQVAGLLEEPSGWANAVEEVLRFDPPVLMTGRLARGDAEVAGERIGRGVFVSTVLLAANRDPAVFEDPHTFDVTRTNARDHISFSAGRHHCLGAALARMEGEVGLRAVFERFPELALEGRGARRPTRVLRGWARLPVRLRPRS